jgi:hypothetical protein
MSTTYFSGVLSSDSVGASPVIVLLRKKLGTGRTSSKSIRQATIKDVHAVSMHVCGRSASLLQGNCWLSWTEQNAAQGTVGSTLIIYKYRGASNTPVAATRPASISMVIIGA